MVRDYIIGQMLDSQTNWIESLEKLSEFAKVIPGGYQFKGKEIPFKGATLKALVNYGFIRVVDKDTYWYQVDEDTMKRGEINIYELILTPDEIEDAINRIRRMKIAEAESKILALRKRLAEAIEDLNALM